MSTPETPSFDSCANVVKETLRTAPFSLGQAARPLVAGYCQTAAQLGHPTSQSDARPPTHFPVVDITRQLALSHCFGTGKR